MNATYLRYELLRLVRNTQVLVFSVGLPLALFVVIGGSNRNEVLDLGGYSLEFSVYYMVSMAGYGAMIAAISGGGRIAAERVTGWNRQLRITPLPGRMYFAAKAITAYLMSILSIALLYAAGLAFGVRLDGVGRWVAMTALLLIGILPFVALGIAAGHLLSNDAIGPAIGGGSAFFAFLGGQWFPLPAGSILRSVGELVPSFWLTAASRVGLGADSWPAKGWAVIVVWSVLASALAVWAYRRDTRRA